MVNFAKRSKSCFTPTFSKRTVALASIPSPDIAITSPIPNRVCSMREPTCSDWLFAEIPVYWAGWADVGECCENADEFCVDAEEYRADADDDWSIDETDLNNGLWKLVVWKLDVRGSDLDEICDEPSKLRNWRSKSRRKELGSQNSDLPYLYRFSAYVI